jgi:ubiquinone/menaquinone biosynthesis C-methylase UbiE
MTEYYVDQELLEEMARLLKQSVFFIKAWGGLLAERPDFAGITSVLDIACGPGEWATQVARAFPHLKVIGMDISQRMIDFAQARVYQDQIENLHFEVGDATHLPLMYEEHSFDLINASLIYGFMTRELWPKLIEECYRLLKPGGFLRIIQEDADLKTNSPGLDEYHRRGAFALYQAGQGFYPHRLGVIPRLPGMFEKAGFVNLTQRHMIVDLSRGSEGYQVAYEDYKTLLSLLRPFLVKWEALASIEEANALYERTMQEMSQGIMLSDGRIDPFVGFWHFSSIFGQKPI